MEAVVLAIVLGTVLLHSFSAPDTPLTVTFLGLPKLFPPPSEVTTVSDEVVPTVRSNHPAIQSSPPFSVILHSHYITHIQLH